MKVRSCEFRLDESAARRTPAAVSESAEMEIADSFPPRNSYAAPWMRLDSRCLAFSNSARRSELSPLPARVDALLVKGPSGGWVESVVTLATHFWLVFPFGVLATWVYRGQLHVPEQKIQLALSFLFGFLYLPTVRMIPKKPHRFVRSGTMGRVLLRAASAVILLGSPA